MGGAESCGLTLSVRMEPRVIRISTRTQGGRDTHDKEHVRPVTTTQGEACFPTTGTSFLLTVTWVAAPATSVLKLKLYLGGVEDGL